MELVGKFYVRFGKFKIIVLSKSLSLKANAFKLIETKFVLSEQSLLSNLISKTYKASLFLQNKENVLQ